MVFSLAIGAIDLDDALLSMAGVTIVQLHVVHDFGHGVVVRIVEAASTAYSCVLVDWLFSAFVDFSRLFLRREQK